MKTAIFHSVNAGLYFWDGQNGLLIDGIHDGRKEGLSPMPALLVRQMRCRSGLFGHLTGMLFTHLHHDHFDEDGVAYLRRFVPGLPVYGPNLLQGSVGVEIVQQDSYYVTIEDISVLAWNTCHDGNAYLGTPHQSFLLTMGDEKFFVAGDAVLQASDAAKMAGIYGDSVKAAFCNLYQLGSTDSTGFLRALAPERVFLYHLPFPEDDHYNYHRLVRQALRNYPADLPPVEQLEHMSWVDGQAAQWETEQGDN